MKVKKYRRVEPIYTLHDTRRDKDTQQLKSIDVIKIVDGKQTRFLWWRELPPRDNTIHVDQWIPANKRQTNGYWKAAHFNDALRIKEEVLPIDAS